MVSDFLTSAKSSTEPGIIASPFDVKLLDTKNNVLMIRLFIQQMPFRDRNTEFDLRVVWTVQ